jgi:hypothetical protein
MSFGPSSISSFPGSPSYQYQSQNTDNSLHITQPGTYANSSSETQVVRVGSRSTQLAPGHSITVTESDLVHSD